MNFEMFVQLFKNDTDKVVAQIAILNQAVANLGMIR